MLTSLLVTLSIGTGLNHANHQYGKLLRCFAALGVISNLQVSKSFYFGTFFLLTYSVSGHLSPCNSSASRCNSSSNGFIIYPTQYASNLNIHRSCCHDFSVVTARTICCNLCFRRIGRNVY